MPDSRRYLFAVGAADRFGSTVDVGALPPQFGPVRPVVAGGLVAFVSTYTGPAIEDAPQRELIGHLLLHQHVIEQLMRTADVLPARLGAVLDSDAAVASLLQTSANLLGATLQRHRDTVEIDVAATWDPAEILGELARDPEVAAAKSAAMAAPDDKRAKAAVSVGKLVEAKLGQRRSGLELRVVQELTPYAQEAHVNAVASDEVVCDLALMVERDKASLIDEALQRLDAELDGRYNFRTVGPLAPYSFATVHVHRVPPDDIERAMALLEISGGFDLAAVQEQYRVLALTRHPDVRRSDPTAARDFEQLTWARKTLAAVCRNGSDGSWVPGSAVLFATVEANTRRS